MRFCSHHRHHRLMLENHLNRRQQLPSNQLELQQAQVRFALQQLMLGSLGYCTNYIPSVCASFNTSS
jgi:hypothetical protein